MSNNEKGTLAEWTSQGFDQQQGASFAQDIQSISALALLVRAIPGWVEEHNTGVNISIDCKPGMGGAAISFAFDKEQLPVASAQELIQRLTQTARLMELESHIEMLRGTSENYELINNLVEEAEQLAETLAR